MAPQGGNALTRIAVMCCAMLVSPLVFSQDYDTLIRNARVLDGTGNPWFQADVGIDGDRIVAVGDLASKRAIRVINAEGKYLTPGFIDLHSHADDIAEEGRSSGLRSTESKRRAAPNLVSQGVTTVVVNQDGRSPESIGAQRRELENVGFGPNVVLLVGHNSVRALSMARNRTDAFSPEEISNMQRFATPDEIARMREMVRRGMQEGAFGISSGLEYIPARWSNTEEVIAIVQEIAPHGGVAVVHERSSGADPMWYLPSDDSQKPTSFLDNIVELIEVGEQTGAVIVATHIKARGANFWGSSHAAIQLINRARARGVQIWADQYPYNTSGSDGSTRLIPGWIATDSPSNGANSKKDFGSLLERVLDDDQAHKKLRADVLHECSRRGGPENILVMDYPDSTFIGKSLADLSNSLDLSLFDLVVKLQLEGYRDKRGGARLRGFSMSEADVEAYAMQPWTATASDAGIAMPGDDPVHARFYGTFARKIRKYVLERGIISLADAIRSATSLPAQILGFRNRGLIREGFYADLVILDLETIRDTATFFNPHQYAEGIEWVLINGQFAIDGGQLTYSLPGQIITPEAARKTGYAN